MQLYCLHRFDGLVLVEVQEGGKNCTLLSFHLRPRSCTVAANSLPLQLLKLLECSVGIPLLAAYHPPSPGCLVRAVSSVLDATARAPLGHSLHARLLAVEQG